MRSLDVIRERANGQADGSGSVWDVLAKDVLFLLEENHRLTVALELIRDTRLDDGARILSGWESMGIASAALEAGQSEHEE